MSHDLIVCIVYGKELWRVEEALADLLNESLLDIDAADSN